VYSTSRMLYGLAAQGDAPKRLLRVNRRGLPVNALGVSALATLCCVALNYWMPGTVFYFLMSLVVSALMINWAMITITHWKFRRAKAARDEKTLFRSIGYPISNVVCLLFMAGILLVMWHTEQTRVSVLLIPAWVMVLFVAYRLRCRKRQPKRA
jgi:aromatic amino acid transport protein AroP